MNKKLDHDQVVLMARTGLHPELIADRLDCSRRQVDRVLKSQGASTFDFQKHMPDEHSEWEFYHFICNESFSRIARRFGVSRQAVHKYFQSITTKTKAS